ncbi:MAG TPA: hydroxymethylpyrimidine/phosphomethylpyrimidine kinase [Candidatus Cybelea sp.]|jgi:hydroxymethylpyrimidine/phosphomethylpyrimidine kinase|nr:hydroxymethylpyrimidine/phosphomethylpyrimidine kinase [Candidatus Cybelea sp.]
MASSVLSIGTTHPWNVAGVGRDLVVGCALRARVFTAVAAISAQDAGGVVALRPVEAGLFESQMRVLPWESAGAVRVGALPTARAVASITTALAQRPWLPAVVDPVLRASSGGELGDAAAREALRDELARLPNVILTPNLAEAAYLLGCELIGRDDIGESARRLRERGPAAVLLTGGHLEGDPADALASGDGVEILSDSRIAGSMHGTGCTLAMALACELAAGSALRHAVRAARAFVRAEIAKH